MKTAQYRDMSNDELTAEMEKLQEQLFKLRIQRVTAKLDNPMKIKNVRRDVARVLTLLNERARRDAAKKG